MIMKQQIVYIILLFFSTLAPTGIISAQGTIRQEACDFSAYQKQIDSLKSYYQGNGFTLLRETPMKMESQYEMSIIVPLNKDEWYSFVFIGDPGCRLYEVRMYDFTEKLVHFEKKLWGDVDGNIINYTYIPRASEYFNIKPVQVHRKKQELCGYVMMFKRVKK